MFSRPVSRAGCPSCSHTLNATLAIRTSTPSSRQGFKSVQRRLSSSKASCPPGNGRTASDSAASNTQSTNKDEDAEHVPVVKEKRPSSASRKKSKVSAAGASTLSAEDAILKAQHEAFASVPTVPPTSHLHEKDVKLSSFFALHRPMSIRNPIPESTSSSSFASIFQTPAPPKWKPADVIYTLNTAVSSLDGSSDPQTLHDSVISQSSSNNGEVQNVNGQAHINIDEVVSKFRPFNKPPAPIPIDPKYQDPQQKRIVKTRQQFSKLRKASAELDRPLSTPEKTYTTTLTISESTDQLSGRKTYSASTSPIVQRQLPPPATKPASSFEKKRQARQPFLHRMQSRGQSQYSSLVNRVSSHAEVSEARAADQAEALENPGNHSAIPADMDASELGLESGASRDMLLISVRRRRKLKMKKHKYKKLTKRLRTIRRREGK